MSRKKDTLRKCAALAATPPAEPTSQADFDRFGRFNNKHVIEAWFQRAVARVADDDWNCFEPFIFTWIAFNAWAESVTALERDKDWVSVLARDSRLTQPFAARIANAGDQMTSAAETFRRYWPIPKMQDWRRKAADRHPASKSNADRVSFFVKHDIGHEPECASHHNDSSAIPLDWEHFLHATYRVRCNLFHGEKGLYDPDDRIIVASAFRTLAFFLDGLRLFGPSGQESPAG